MCLAFTITYPLSNGAFDALLVAHFGLRMTPVAGTLVVVQTPVTYSLHCRYGALVHTSR